jgi:hypothetical protein
VLLGFGKDIFHNLSEKKSPRIAIGRYAAGAIAAGIIAVNWIF